MFRLSCFAAFCLTSLPLALHAAPPPSPSPTAKSPIQDRADRFLVLTNASYQALYRVNSEAQWSAVTDVTPEHDAASEAAAKAYAAFNGNPALITEVRDLLKQSDELAPLTVREVYRNKLIGRVRGRVEGVFGALKRSYGLARMRLVGLHVVRVRADVADVRKGEGDDLPRERRVGHDLLIAGHRGVKAHLAHRLAFRAEAAAPHHVPGREHQHAGGSVGRGRAERLGVGHGRRALLLEPAMSLSPAS